MIRIRSTLPTRVARLCARCCALALLAWTATAADLAPQERELLTAFDAELAAHAAAKAQGRAADNHGRLLQLARDRRAIMRRLVREDPAKAVELALDRVRRAELPEQARAEVEEEVSAVGRYDVLIARPEEPGQAPVVRRRAEIDGRTYEVRTWGRANDLSSPRRSLQGVVVDGVLALSPNRVRVLKPGEPAAANKARAALRCPVSGRAAGLDQEPEDQDADVVAESGDTVYYLCSAGHVGAVEGQVAAADGAAITAAGETVMPSAWTEGPKTHLYIIARFSDEANWPASIATGQNTCNGLDTFFQTSSYGKTSITSTVVQVTMPQPKSYYAGVSDTQVLTDARNAAAALGYTYTDYNLDSVRYSGIWGFSGQAYVGSRGCWMQTDSSGVLAHEIGHNYGLWHANFWNSASGIGLGANNEYGDPYSEMGGSGEFLAYERWRLNWLTATQVQTITTSGTYRVFACDNGTPVDGNRYGLIVTKDAQRDYWISKRDDYTSNAWVQNGVFIHWDPWFISGEGDSAGGPHLIDTTPSSANGKNDAPVVLGRTFSDTKAGIHITPVARIPGAPSAMDVVVNLGQFPGNRPPTLAVQPNAYAVPTGVPVAFTLTAADPDGDSLSIAWDFADGTFTSATTAPVKSWGTAKEYPVRVSVSDMKGGVVEQTVVIRVGSPADTARISGRVLWGGRPLAAARIAIAGTVRTLTEPDGSYTIPGLAAGSHAVTCAYDNLTFAAQFTGPVALTAGQVATGIDFHATQAWIDPLAPATYSVSGTVWSGGSGMAGVVVGIGGKATTSAGDGTWTITGIPDGSWPVQAAAANASFSAVNANVSGANLTGLSINRLTYTISGQVTTPSGNTSVTVRAGSSSTTVVTSNSQKRANYSLTVPAGAYTVIASATGLDFGPGVAANVSAGNATANFSGATGTVYQIRGQVTVNGIPVAGVTVATSGGSAVTGPDGAYVIGDLAAGSYTVTPSIAGGVFSPASIPATITSADLTAQNFTLTDAAPTVQTAAAASPATVTTPTGTTILSVLGADNGGEASLTYTWRATSGPYPVTFSANGTNGAKSVTAAFQGAGSYTLQATIVDSRQQRTTSSVPVTVQAAATGLTITVSPYETELGFGDTVAYSAKAWDASGQQVAITPVWATSAGSITGGGSFQATVSNTTAAITATASGASGTGYAAIIGNAGPKVTLATTDATAGEPGLGLGDGAFTLTRNIATGPLTVAYTVGGTATAGGDYTALSGSVVMAAGVASVPIPVAVLDDALAEAHETVVVTLVAGPDYNLGTTTSGTVTIKDDEAPLVTVAAGDNAAAEPGVSGGNGTFTLTRSGNPDAALTVVLSMGGLVSAGDYTGVGATAAIAGGSTSTVLTLVPVNDSESELAETAILTVAPGAGYTPGSPASATVTISDDDPVVVRVATTDAASGEQSSDDGVFTVTRLGNRSAAVNVAYALSGAAVNGTDYTTRTGVVAVGGNSNTATVSIDPIDDSLYEGPETAVITLSASGGYTVGSPASDSVTIADNDKPTVSVVATDALADEAGGTAVFTVSRSGVTGLGDLTVAYTVSGSAVAGGDVQPLSGTVVIPQGQASATVTLTPLADDLVEAPETVTVTIATAGAYLVAGSPANAATATLVDDTETPMLTVATGDNTASEPAKGDGTATVVISRAGAPGAELSVPVLLSGSAVAGSDYQAIASPVTIPAGQTSVTVTLTAIDDGVAEPDESATLTLQAGDGYGLGTSTAATVNLYDDEAAQMAVEISDADCTEASSSGTGQYLLRRLGNRSAALTVAYAMSGTATAGSDYTALAGSVALGANSGSTTVTVTPINDALVEGPETAILTVSVGTGYTPAATAAGTIEIRDDETPDVTVAVQDAVCGEPADAGSFRISRSAASASPLTVTFTVAGTAVAGSDYTALSGSAIIPANGTSVDVAVAPVADAVVEGPETVVLSLTGAGPSYDLGLARSAILTVRDDEVPTITVVASDAAAAEPADPGVFTLTASPAPASPLTVAYTMGGGAGNGIDYQALGGTVVIAAGATTATVAVAPVDDALAEGAETATLTLAAGSGYNVGTTTGVNVTIAANDTPVATVTAADAAAAEAGLDAARFLVALSNPAAGNTTVTYSVGGTATTGSDYTALTGSVTVNAGQTSAVVTVTPVDDALAEGGETVAITLTAAAAYTLGSPVSATAAIADNDGVSPQLVLSTTAVAVPEGGQATVTVALTMAPSGTASVTVARTAGDGDITVAGGAVLVFDAGSWATPQTVTLAAAQDGDAVASVATITVSAAGMTPVDIAATEVEDDAANAAPVIGVPAVVEGADLVLP